MYDVACSAIRPKPEWSGWDMAYAVGHLPMHLVKHPWTRRGRACPPFGCVRGTKVGLYRIVEDGDLFRGPHVSHPAPGTPETGRTRSGTPTGW